MFQKNSLKKQIAFWLVFTGVLGISLFLHFYALEIKPVHHDEGVNGWFIGNLLKKGEYTYSSKHYHGPTLFYLGKYFATLWGHNIFALRLIPAIFGFLLCFSPLLLLKKYFHPGAVLITALALTASPANIFYGRYLIHETLFVCFITYAALCFFIYFFEEQEIFLYFTAVLLGCAAASKESVVISMFAVFIGLFLAFICSKEGFRENWGRVVKRYKKDWLNQLVLPLLGFLALFFAVMLRWFDFKELIAFFKSYLFYKDLGAIQSGHAKPSVYFLKLLWRYEWFLLFGATGGAIAALYTRRKIDLFCLGWALISLMVYSFLSYKTPWLIINITVPMAFLFGVFIHFIIQKIHKKASIFAFFGVLIICSSFSLEKSYVLSLKEFDEKKNTYFYVHTIADAHVLERRIKELLTKYPKEKVAFLSDESWPYPFLLYDFPQILWWGNVQNTVNESIIVVRDKQVSELKPKLKKEFIREDYVMRPGVNLQLWIAKDLLQKK